LTRIAIVVAAVLIARPVVAEPDAPAGGSAPVTVVLPSARPTPEPATAEPTDQLTTDAWRPQRHFDLHWRLLYLPGRALELGLMPLHLLIEATEEYRLDRRFNDLVEFDHGRYKISPRFRFSFGDGLGAGARISRRKLFHYRGVVGLGALYRLNGDWQAELEYEHKLLFPGGRGLRTYVFTELDKNRRYYGLGNTTSAGDRRVLGTEEQGFYAETDIQGIDRYTTYGTAAFAVRRQQLFAGEDSGEIPIGMTGDTVAPPTDFGGTAIYGDIHLVGRYDTRDTQARPTRGWLLELGMLLRKELTGKELSGITATATARVYLPIIAEGRALSFSVGGIASSPLFPGDETPLDSQAVLGRSILRSFDRERFRDRYALWGSAEYRFPIYEYLASKAGLDAFVFFDSGVVFGEQDFSLDPLHYSYGLGIRAAHETTLVFQSILGRGPEGFELSIGVEKAL
jgi:hypothetical protein